MREHDPCIVWTILNQQATNSFSCISLLQGVGKFSHSMHTMKGRGGRRRKLLLDDLKETRGYWKLKGEAQGGTGRVKRFGRIYGPIVREIRNK